jgi:hypothetical protein
MGVGSWGIVMFDGDTHKPMSKTNVIAWLCACRKVGSPAVGTFRSAAGRRFSPSGTARAFRLGNARDLRLGNRQKGYFYA